MGYGVIMIMITDVMTSGHEEDGVFDDDGNQTDPPERARTVLITRSRSAIDLSCSPISFEVANDDRTHSSEDTSPANPLTTSSSSVKSLSDNMGFMQGRDSVVALRKGACTVMSNEELPYSCLQQSTAERVLTKIKSRHQLLSQELQGVRTVRVSYNQAARCVPRKLKPLFSDSDASTRVPGSLQPPRSD